MKKKTRKLLCSIAIPVATGMFFMTITTLIGYTEDTALLVGLITSYAANAELT